MDSVIVGIRQKSSPFVQQEYRPLMLLLHRFPRITRFRGHSDNFKRMQFAPQTVLKHASSNRQTRGSVCIVILLLKGGMVSKSACTVFGLVAIVIFLIVIAVPVSMTVLGFSLAKIKRCSDGKRTFVARCSPVVCRESQRELIHALTLLVRSQYHVR